jgi:hypothetical protein
VIQIELNIPENWLEFHQHEIRIEVFYLFLFMNYFGISSNLITLIIIHSYISNIMWYSISTNSNHHHNNNNINIWSLYQTCLSLMNACCPCSPHPLSKNNRNSYQIKLIQISHDDEEVSPENPHLRSYFYQISCKLNLISWKENDLLTFLFLDRGK